MIATPKNVPPVAWRIIDSNGTDYGTFISKDKADRFATSLIDPDRTPPIHSVEVRPDYTTFVPVVYARGSAGTVIRRYPACARQSEAWDKAREELDALGDRGAGCAIERVEVPQ